MRGRLIRPALVELQQIDTAATAADPEIAGLVSGYDAAFGEPATQETTSGAVSTVGSLLRYKEPTIKLPAQVEVNAFKKSAPAAVGRDQQGLITLVFHFSDLEELDMVDATTGEPKINAGDRLVAMYQIEDETLIQQFNKPYLYAKQPRGYGPGLGGFRNLCIVDFATRDVGQQV